MIKFIRDYKQNHIIFKCVLNSLIIFIYIYKIKFLDKNIAFSTMLYIQKNAIFSTQRNLNEHIIMFK